MMRVIGLNNVIFISSVINAMNAVKIQNLLIPELVQIGNVTEIILDCQYTKPAHDRVVVGWYFNGSKEPVYQWRPNTKPKVTGILSGRLDLSFRISKSLYDEGRALRIIDIGPDLSGEYTCSVESNDTKVLKKTMLVFSPEQELILKVNQQKSENLYEAKCTARGLFPSPDLVLKYGNDLIEKQQQRVWRTGGDQPLFDAESTAYFRGNCQGAVSCRLVLPEAGYISIKEATIADKCRNHSSRLHTSSVYIYLTVGIIFIFLYINRYTVKLS